MMVGVAGAIWGSSRCTSNPLSSGIQMSMIARVIVWFSACSRNNRGLSNGIICSPAERSRRPNAFRTAASSSTTQIISGCAGTRRIFVHNFRKDFATVSFSAQMSDTKISPIDRILAEWLSRRYWTLVLSVNTPVGVFLPLRLFVKSAGGGSLARFAAAYRRVRDPHAVAIHVQDLIGQAHQDDDR